MMINKYLQQHKYIIVRNCNLDYLKMLTNIGSIPIFIYINRNNERIIAFGCNEPLFSSLCLRYSLFNFDCLTIAEIKLLFRNTKVYKLDSTSDDIFFEFEFKFNFTMININYIYDN